jgi:hypothetical protein
VLFLLDFKMRIKNKAVEKAGISISEILILVISIFAFSYLIYQPTKIVSAQDSSLYTCEESKQGEICQEFLSSECNEKCKETCFPGRRENFAECKLGCCIDTTGKCMANSPKAKCGVGGGEWKDNAGCSQGNLVECKTGCCVLGSGVRALVTEKECEFYSLNAGLDLDWRPGMSEPECLALALTQEKGACVLGSGEEKTCKMTAASECLVLRGEFSSGFLCTHSELNTNCKKTEETTCMKNEQVGKEGVYFLDSCGNIANIYDASKINDEDYWSRIYTGNEICGKGSPNINSKSCGNCNYMLGSRCDEGNADYGQYICKDMSCPDAPDNNRERKDRKNGESWCVFDGAVGKGKDLVGSRHFRYSCIDGEVKVEPCADFRNEICVQSDIEENNIGFSTASCRLNQWQVCLEANIDKKGLAGCEENIDCRKFNMNIGDYPGFDVCVPKYPEGFDVREQESAETSKAICRQANFKCNVVYEKKLGGWKCVHNCDCEEASFTNQMHKWCSSLGDCGFKKNTAGECVKNYKVSNAPESAKCVGSLNWEGNYPEPGDVSGFFEEGETSGTLPNEGEGEYATKEVGISRFLMISGAMGAGIGAALVLTPAVSWGAGGMSTAIVIESAGPWIGVLASVGNALAGAAIGAAVGMITAKLLGIEGQGAMMLTMAGAVGGIMVALSLLWSPSWFGPAGIIIFIATLIIVLILGIGKTKEKTVRFRCLPWQAPIGGQDCEKCNNAERPCSKYRCQSLGQACKFLNEGTGNELCMASKNDGKPPVISVLEEALSEGYKYEMVEGGFKIVNKDSEDGCILAFTPLSFGIKTDEASQCKYDVVHTTKFDEMSEWFGDNLYKFNHSMQMSLPSVESIAEQFNVTTEHVEEKYGNLKLLMRCSDDWGNFNIKEYLIQVCVKPGPDITPPLIMKMVPENGAYLSFGQIEQDVTIYLNEPSECKYDLQDKEYEQMKNSFSCKVNLQEQTVWGWPCLTTLADLMAGENKIYIRCKDQPWLAGENESARNANQQSYVLELKGSESELEIESVVPEGVVLGGDEPLSVNLELRTSGGAEQGKSSCYYQWAGNWILFLDTFSAIHKQQGLNLYGGSYKIPVKCEDIAGNIAENETDFEIKVDKSSPRVIRVYNEGNLKIITNEDAKCAYTFNTCNFVWENATEMSGLQREHTASWEKGRTYYIKCKDLWDNKPDGCSIIVKAV